MPILAVNKRARFDYEITDTFEAGLVLFGHEVKSIKTGHISLKGAFITAKAVGKSLPELYLTNSFVPAYKFAGDKVLDYKPDRSRKLLLNKKQIGFLVGKKQEQGLTLVPIKIYTKHNLLKLEFGIGKGKHKYEKREDIKRRDIDRDLKTLSKQGKVH
jgi:SsrA-binding protein